MEDFISRTLQDAVEILTASPEFGLDFDLTSLVGTLDIVQSYFQQPAYENLLEDGSVLKPALADTRRTTYEFAHFLSASAAQWIDDNIARMLNFLMKDLWKLLHFVDAAMDPERAPLAERNTLQAIIDDVEVFKRTPVSALIGLSETSEFYAEYLNLLARFIQHIQGGLQIFQGLSAAYLHFQGMIDKTAEHFFHTFLSNLLDLRKLMDAKRRVDLDTLESDLYRMLFEHAMRKSKHSMLDVIKFLSPESHKAALNTIRENLQ